MQTSESIAKLAAALVKAQAEIEHPKKTSTNPHLRNKFADLAEVFNTVRPVLAKHGLAVVQTTGHSDTAVTVTTMLVHESGEFIADTVGLPVTDQKGLNLAQAAGSIITYLRRYSLSAITGVASEPDDDGNESKGDNGKPPKASTPAPAARGPQL